MPGPGVQEGAAAEGTFSAGQAAAWVRPGGGKFRAEFSESRRHILHVAAGAGAVGPG